MRHPVAIITALAIAAAPSQEDAVLGQLQVSGTMCRLAEVIDGEPNSRAYQLTAVDTGLIRLSDGYAIDEMIDLYRVTSGFFTSDGGLGITNAGMNHIVFVDGESRSPASQVGTPGPGPEEFSALYFAHWRPANERIVAYDQGQGAVKEFDTEGRLIRFVRLAPTSGLPIYDVHPLGETEWLGVASDNSVSRTVGGVRVTEAPVVIIDSLGITNRAIAMVPGRERIRFSGGGGGFAVYDRPFAHEPWVATDTKGCFAHGTRNSADVIVRNMAGEALAQLAVPGVDLTLREDSWRARVDRMTHVGARQRRLPALRKPERRPAWSRGVFDGVDRLWLEVYHHRDEPATAWWVVDLRELTASFVPAPPGSQRLLAADPTRAAILARDEYEAERVVLMNVLVGETEQNHGSGN